MFGICKKTDRLCSTEGYLYLKDILNRNKL
jgi:hypothetical protein